jgi:hypothetical protein
MFAQITDFELGDDSGVDTLDDAYELEGVCRLQCMIALLLEKNEKLRMQLFTQGSGDRG